MRCCCADYRRSNLNSPLLLSFENLSIDCHYHKMCTSVMLREKCRSATSISLFPSESQNFQQSTHFVKKLVAVAVSNITYLRAIFPELAFLDRVIDDLHIKILCEKNGCKGAATLIKWLHGSFEALEKKYLRQLTIGIFVDPKKEDTLIESYSFRFTYQDSTTMNLYRNDARIASTESTMETKKATISLLRTLLILMQTLNPLPDRAMMTMKLLYYDEVTPSDYEPAGFQPSKSDSFLYEINTTSINVGNVYTPFHSLKLRVRTDSSQFDIQDAGSDSEDIPCPHSTTKENDAIKLDVPQEAALEQPEAQATLTSDLPSDMPTPELLSTQIRVVSEELTESREICLPNVTEQSEKSQNKNKNKNTARGKNKITSPTKTLCGKRPLSDSQQQQTVDISAEINTLSLKTKSLSMSGTVMLNENKINRNVSVKSNAKECSISNNKKGCKSPRIIAVKNQQAAFTLDSNDSQEHMDEAPLRRSKRRKASDIYSPIVV